MSRTSDFRRRSDDVHAVCSIFLQSLKDGDVPLTKSLLCDVLAKCAATCDDVENVTILVDESGRLPKLLKMGRR